MEQFLINHEAAVRLASFIGMLALMGVAEALWPKRTRALTRTRRWSNTAALMLLNSTAVRLVLPIVAVSAAALAAERGWGLLNMISLPFGAAALVSFVLLDFAIWAQHVALHKVPLFWRFHRMHHSDVDLDAMSGARFHPVEILASMLYKVALVLTLGAPVAAVIFFECMLTGAAVFNHANLRLPLGLDRWLRWLLVTPDMHRVHHSATLPETDSNYGFFLPWWDRLFGTYIDQPAAGHEGMTVGLESDRAPRDARLDQILLQPFRARSPVRPRASRS